MKKVVMFLASAAAAFFMVSCSQDPVIDGSWDLVKFEGEEVSCIDIPCLIFSKEDGNLYGSTGVNRFFGSYTIDGTKLQMTAAGATKMAGPEEDMRFEQRFLNAMGGLLTVKAKGEDRLLLYGENGDVIMELVKSEEE